MANRQYVGARYVPKFADPVEWNGALSYEALTIVTHLGNSFTSKKPVPAGIDIGNTEYWVNTGNYNEQLANCENQIIAFSKKLELLKDYTSVYEFGAVGDGVHDDTDSFVAALNSEHNIIVVPSGVYKITKSVNIPENKTLMGCSGISPKWNGEKWVLYPGTTIAVYHGRNVSSATFVLNNGSTICDMSFYYPEVGGSQENPIEYSPCIESQGTNVSDNTYATNDFRIVNCKFSNPYIAINLKERHSNAIIKNCQMWYWYRGIVIDGSYDTDKVYDVRCSPVYAYIGDWGTYPNTAAKKTAENENSASFVIKKADLSIFENCFVWGGRNAFLFEKSQTGFASGCQFINCSAEQCEIIFYMKNYAQQLEIRGGAVGACTEIIKAPWGGEASYEKDTFANNIITDLKCWGECKHGINLDNCCGFIFNSCSFNSIGRDVAFDTAGAITVTNSKKVFFENCCVLINDFKAKPSYVYLDNVTKTLFECNKLMNLNVDKAGVTILSGNNIAFVNTTFVDTTTPSIYKPASVTNFTETGTVTM